VITTHTRCGCTASAAVEPRHGPRPPLTTTERTEPPDCTSGWAARAILCAAYMRMIGTAADAHLCMTDSLWAEMRGVTLFEVVGGQIAAGRLCLEDVERDIVGIEQAVEDLSGRGLWSAAQ